MTVEGDAVPLVAVRRAEAAVRAVSNACAAADRPEDAAVLLFRLSGNDDESRVVVAGETCRGKSMLINALVGRPGLSPTGVAETTGCPIAFRRGPADVASARYSGPDGEAEERPIALADVAAATTLGSEELAVAVSVELDEPALDGLVLIDTPGVGGVSGGHGLLTLAALEDSDALLFVLDAVQPVLAPEIAFLEKAAGRLAAIVVAVTKCDASPDFEQVLAESRGHLAMRPALAHVPVVGVSARLAEQAAELRADGQQDHAELLAGLSGVDDLLARLREVAAARAYRLRLANLAQRAAEIARVAVEQLERRGAGRSRDEQLAALRMEHERLAAMAKNEQPTRIAISHRLQQMRTDPRQLFDEETSVLRQTWRAAAESGPAAELPQIAARLEGDLAAAALNALRRQQELTASILDVLRTELDHAEGDAVLAAVGAADRTDLGLPDVGTPFKMRGQSMFAAITSLGLTRFATTSAMAVLGGPLGLLAGGGAGLAVLGGGLWRVAQGNEQQLRAHLRSWVDQAVAEARSNVSRDLDRRGLAVQQLVENELPLALARLVTLDAELRAQQAALTAAGRDDGTTDAAERDVVERLRQAGVAAAAAARALLADPDVVPA